MRSPLPSGLFCLPCSPGSVSSSVSRAPFLNTRLPALYFSCVAASPGFQSTTTSRWFVQPQPLRRSQRLDSPLRLLLLWRRSSKSSPAFDYERRQIRHLDCPAAAAVAAPSAAPAAPRSHSASSTLLSGRRPLTLRPAAAAAVLSGTAAAPRVNTLRRALTSQLRAPSPPSTSAAPSGASGSPAHRVSGFIGVLGHAIRLFNNYPSSLDS